MKVAQCIHGVGLGGAQQVVRSLVAGSTGRELRHVVYCSVDGVRRGEIEAAGAPVRVVRRRVPKLDPLWALALAREMRRDGVDLVHTHLFGDTLHGVLAARLLRLPVVVTLHSLAPAFTDLQRLGYRWLARRAAAVIACSDEVRSTFRSLLDESIDIRTIHNGIEVRREPDPLRLRREVRDELGWPDRAVVFCAAGRLVPGKGYPVLLDALARVAADRDVRLVLAGEGPDRADLAERIARNGLAERVKLLGYCADVRRLLCGVDVVAFSSFVEGLPITLLEAMAAARCIVATRVGGIPEAIEQGRQGWLVSAGDVRELASAMRAVADDWELRERLGAAARERFEARFSAAEMVRRYAEVYREVAPEPRRAAA